MLNRIYSRPCLVNRRFVAGIAWFRADSGKLTSFSVHRCDELERTYEEWVAIAEKTVQRPREQGVFARKVDVDVNELQAWCSAQSDLWTHPPEPSMQRHIFRFAERLTLLL